VTSSTRGFYINDSTEEVFDPTPSLPKSMHHSLIDLLSFVSPLFKRFDVKDHYKDLGGDAAAFVAPCNDLQGVKAYCAVDIEGLHTLGTVVVDYRGYRVTAQSIIPGILEREQEQSVIYGSVDFGKTVVAHEKYLELLSKAAQSLKILPHRVLNEKDEIVEICSSVECKGIIGNDGRLLRTFPPDVNFLPGCLPESEYSKEVRELGFPRKHRHKLASLRQELVDAFFEARYTMFFKLAYLQLGQNKKKIQNEEKSGLVSNGNASFQNGIPEVQESVKELSKSSLKSEETKDVVRKAAQAVGSLKDNEFDLRFDVDVFSESVRNAESEEELQRQRLLIRDAFRTR